MSADVEAKNVLPSEGGIFLLKDVAPGQCFFPEDFTAEHRQIAETAADFCAKEIMPVSAQIEAKDFALSRALLRKAGELGLLAADIPEEYGGLDLDKTASAIIGERMAHQGSFAVTFSVQTGIGTLPIVWYGTPQQKEKYLPKLATGEWVGAYALSESSSASDAMNARTRATLSADGSHYILNGEKMWISNGGFADVFTVFAKVDGEKFTAFLIERGMAGFSHGAEEHKLGIRGTSTTPLILSDCKVPVENVLGEVGKGHHIAFNILNIGRFKMCASTVGSARAYLADTVRYARDRKAFGKSISDFGLIREKLAEIAIGIFTGEAMVYRTTGMMDAALSSVDKSAADLSLQIQKRIEEYAIECSILKVWGSEMLDEVVDHIVQIFGGYGFVEDYFPERAYRDSRINRIFEGTNEINRMLITGMLMKRALAGKLPVMQAIKRTVEELMAGPLTHEITDAPLDVEFAQLSSAKKIALFTAGIATERFGAKLAEEQEIMAAVADILIQLYAMESTLLRARKIVAQKSTGIASAIARVAASESFAKIDAAAQRILAASAEGDTLRLQMTLLRRLTKRDPANTIALKREIAGHIIAAGKYAL